MRRNGSEIAAASDTELLPRVQAIVENSSVVFSRKDITQQGQSHARRVQGVLATPSPSPPPISLHNIIVQCVVTNYSASLFLSRTVYNGLYELGHIF